ncbi:MAG TPA: uracil-DNA glycosylase [Chloroflexia bacterium]|nr:uracil-DNA glycosylase [Chloroflexia bacterium]
MTADPQISLNARTPAEAAGPAYFAGDRAAALAALRTPALACIRCDLKLTRTQVVFGVGNPDAQLILFGEAPGADEDARGLPFQGRAGQVLNGLLADAGIRREEIWVSNTVKCRPTKVEGKRVSNRPPRVGEVRACAIWREGEMDLLKPPLICCLGATAAAAILGREVKMTKERGVWFPSPAGAQVLITYHPSYVMRQIGPDYDRIRGEALVDLQKVATRLAETKS